MNVPDHCNGCGKPDRLVTAAVDPAKLLLLPVAPDIFPDKRGRYLCPKCIDKLRHHQKRLHEAGSGHLT